MLKQQLTMVTAAIFVFFLLEGCHKDTSLSRMENQNMHGQEALLQDGSEVFFILLNQQFVAAQKQTPESFYIKGVIEHGEFTPKSEILGIGELAKSGRHGWLELSSREFFPMESGRKATTPFVKGYMQDAGFVPSIRTVFTEPK